MKRKGDISDCFLQNNKQADQNRAQPLHHHRTPNTAPYLRLVRVSVVRLHKDPVYHHQVRASTRQSVTESERERN